MSSDLSPPRNYHGTGHRQGSMNAWMLMPKIPNVLMLSRSPTLPEGASSATSSARLAITCFIQYLITGTHCPIPHTIASAPVH